MTDEIKTPSYRSDMTVKLVRSMASDDMVVQAAQVSSKGENKPDTVPYRLLLALMAGKHGSPFEHNAMTFYCEVPIFVMREWIRHRISSFNEVSGRYKELEPVFYVPDESRPVINVGTKMKPEFVSNLEATMDIQGILNHGSESAWEHYDWMIKNNIAPEVARLVLPVNVYTAFYWTVNARSLMNFLSLRSSQEGAAVKSYPQREIQMAAEQVETIFAELMPLTYRAFIEGGRVAP